MVVLAFRSAWQLHRSGDPVGAYLVAATWMVLLITFINHHPRFEPFWMGILAVAIAFTQRGSVPALPRWVSMCGFAVVLGVTGYAFAQYAGSSKASSGGYSSWFEALARPGVNAAQGQSFAGAYHPETMWRTADQAWQAGDETTAREWSAKLLKNFPAHRSANILMAELHCESGETREAMQYLLALSFQSEELLLPVIIQRVAQDSLASMQDKFSERPLMLTLRAMANTPSWSAAVLRNAAINDLDFDQQAIADACYYMHANCQSDDCDLVGELVEKYIPEVPMNFE